MYYAQLANGEQTQRFATLQELGEWIAEGWDVQFPEWAADSAEDMQEWLHTHAKSCTLHKE